MSSRQAFSAETGATTSTAGQPRPPIRLTTTADEILQKPTVNNFNVGHW